MGVLYLDQCKLAAICIIYFNSILIINTIKVATRLVSCKKVIVKVILGGLKSILNGLQCPGSRLIRSGSGKNK